MKYKTILFLFQRISYHNLLWLDFYPKKIRISIERTNLRGCLHDKGGTFIPGRDEKLHRVFIKPCLLGCGSYSAVKLMKL